MGISDWLSGERSQQSAAANVQPTSPATPKQQPDVPYTVIDVPGAWVRSIVGDDHFLETIESLPLGPVKVIMRLEPNEPNSYGIWAYVGNRQVGWLATDLAPTDPWVVWMTRLDAAHIWPRLQGLHQLTEIRGEHVIEVQVPGPNDEDLSAIADRFIGGN